MTNEEKSGAAPKGACKGFAKQSLGAGGLCLPSIFKKLRRPQEANAEQVEKHEKKAARRRRLLTALGTYLDDLLFVAGGVCFTAAAGLRFGGAAALAVAGACLTACAITVARASQGR